MNKITVLMCEHNTYLPHLKLSVESILSQTYANFDFIIVVDTTFDENLSYLTSLTDSRISIIKNISNIGLAASLNNAISSIETDYIVRMDTDDISHSDRISEQLKFIEDHPQYAIVSCSYNTFDDNGIYNKSSFHGEVTLKHLIKSNMFSHPGMILNTKILKEINGYPLFQRAQDYAMIFELYSCGYKGCVMEQILLDYRMDSSGYKKKKFKFRVLEYKIRSFYYKKLRVEFIYRVYKFKPIFIGLIPNCIYKLLHKKRRGVI